jgi:hypothetical protein
VVRAIAMRVADLGFIASVLMVLREVNVEGCTFI